MSSHPNFFCPVAFHDALADEIPEDILSIPTESRDNEQESIPVRVLSDFTIYEGGTNQLIPTGELLEGRLTKHMYAASGVVKPWVDDSTDSDSDSDSDSDDHESADDDHKKLNVELRVKTGKILEFNVHDFSNTSIDGSVVCWRITCN